MDITGIITTAEEAFTILEQLISWFKNNKVAATPVTPSASTDPDPYDHFDACFAYAMKNEGGYSNDPADSGGPTNWGLTQSDYSKYYGRTVSATEIQAMTQDDAKPIMKAYYYLPSSVGQIASEAVAVALFDIGLVQGIATASKFAQQVCNALSNAKLDVDGETGPLTIAAINAQKDIAPFLTQFEALVAGKFNAIVAANASQKVFLTGWLNRAKEILSLIS